MTKKHFTALAWELASVRPSRVVDGEAAYTTWLACVEAVTIVCRESNSAFDAQRFVGACHGQALVRDGKRKLVSA